MAWTVADVMTRDVVTVAPDTTFKACADLMRIHGISALPVLNGHRLVGLVSEADLMRSVADGGGPTPAVASDVMTPDVVTVAQSATIAAAARLMFSRRVKRLPVIDGSRRLVGIVSRADVLRVFLRSDESIRKEIAHGILDELPLLGRGRVQVDVKDGVVRLGGEVESGSLTGLLVRLIAAVPGVVGVENHLHQTPSPVDQDMPAAEVGGRRRA